jgi:hypothetical protein
VYAGLSGSSSNGTDYYLCRRDEPQNGPDFPNNCSNGSVDFNGRSIGSTALKDETSTSQTYGIVWSPTRNIELTADYYDIKLSDEVIYQSSDIILREEANCRLGQTVGGRYVIKKILGEGGMGRVYEAERMLAGASQRVAVKTLHAHLSSDPQIVARFHRECRTMAGLRHPNTIKVEDFGQTADGTLYIVGTAGPGSTIYVTHSLDAKNSGGTPTWTWSGWSASPMPPTGAPSGWRSPSAHPAPFRWRFWPPSIPATASPWRPRSTPPTSTS